jgi:hypothetical protein
MRFAAACGRSKRGKLVVVLRGGAPFYHMVVVVGRSTGEDISEIKGEGITEQKNKL